MTKGELKTELKLAIAETKDYNDMIEKTSIYIINNFKRRDKPIDSVSLLKEKKKRKHKK
jgi:hypothetical protein